ncbi:MAG: phosphoglucosamine mutase, partial [Bdellovibrionota bacterium]
RVARRIPLDQNAPIQKALEKAKQELGSDGRVFARYSGTEPLVRILIEGTDAGRIERTLGDLTRVFAAELG